MKKRLALLLALTFALTLVGCSATQESNTPTTPSALVPAVMVNGELYCTTGKQIPAEVDESAIIGEITAVVPLSQWPTEEGQANFGEVGTPLAFTADGLLVLVNNEWTIFALREGNE